MLCLACLLCVSMMYMTESSGTHKLKIQHLLTMWAIFCHSELLCRYHTHKKTTWAVMPVAEKPGFVSYSIQKIDRPDANYMLFWLQSSSSEHTLGIVVNISCCSIFCSLLHMRDVDCCQQHIFIQI